MDRFSCPVDTAEQRARYEEGKQSTCILNSIKATWNMENTFTFIFIKNDVQLKNKNQASVN